LISLAAVARIGLNIIVLYFDGLQIAITVHYKRTSTNPITKAFSKLQLSQSIVLIVKMMASTIWMVFLQVYTYGADETDPVRQWNMLAHDYFFMVLSIVECVIILAIGKQYVIIVKEIQALIQVQSEV